MLTFSLHFDEPRTQTEIDTLFNALLTERCAGKSGYYDLPFDTKALDEANAYIEHNRDFLETLTHLVIIGIGGSSLGLKAIDSMLAHLPHRRALTLIFLEHTDPLHIAQNLKDLQKERTLFIAISKSGTTIETSSLLKYVLHTYDLLVDSMSKRHLLIITDTQSPLQHFASSQSLQYFCIAQNVGGRFSVLSAVGIVPLAILGFDIAAILKGGAAMAESFFSRKAEHILHKAISYAKHKAQTPINVLFSYSSLFRHFNAWYVQLWGESLGKIDKNGQKNGLTPIALIGSIDQHSFLQLIVQGAMDKTVTFLSLHPSHSSAPHIPTLQLPFLESTDFVNGASFARLLDNQRIATMQTIENEGIMTDCIEISELCEESVGGLIVYFELLTSSMGVLFHIDAYNQPGVEYGKKRLKALFKAT